MDKNDSLHVLIPIGGTCDSLDSQLSVSEVQESDGIAFTACMDLRSGLCDMAVNDVVTPIGHRLPHSDGDSSSPEEVDYETQETLAIRNAYSELSEAIGHQLDKVSTEFYSSCLIEDTVLQQVLEMTSVTNLVKTAKVLNVVMTKVRSAPSNFNLFLRVLEKCGLREITHRIMANYNELITSQRPSPIGNSDNEFVRHRPSSADPAMRHRRSKSCKHYRRGESHPAQTTATHSEATCTSTHSRGSTKHRIHRQHSTESDSDVGDITEDEGILDENVIRQQVRQLNIEVLKLKKRNRKLREGLQERDATIISLRESNEKLVARIKNLELQNNFLLYHQQSLVSSPGDEDVDNPLLSWVVWTGCQRCYRTGNIRCRESVV